MVEKILKYISETLIQNEVNVSNPGLIYGKMGLAVFYFHYARYTGDQSFEEYAMILMEKLQEQIQQQHTINYRDGLAGIGTGIEYLVRNGFLEADTNEVLEDLDKEIFRATVFGNHADVSLFTGLSGLGRYLLFRVEGKYANDDYISTLDNKMLLIHITDAFERKYPSMKTAEIEEVFFFLHAMEQTNIFPTKAKQLLKSISSYLSSSKQDEIMSGFLINKAEMYRRKYNEYLSKINGDNQTDILPGLYGGLAGIGLYLLSTVDKQHETWMELI